MMRRDSSLLAKLDSRLQVTFSDTAQCFGCERGFRPSKKLLTLNHATSGCCGWKGVLLLLGFMSEPLQKVK